MRWLDELDLEERAMEQWLRELDLAKGNSLSRQGFPFLESASPRREEFLNPKMEKPLPELREKITPDPAIESQRTLQLLAQGMRQRIQAAGLKMPPNEKANMSGYEDRCAIARWFESAVKDYCRTSSDPGKFDFADQLINEKINKINIEIDPRDAQLDSCVLIVTWWLQQMTGLRDNDGSLTPLVRRFAEETGSTTSREWFAAWEALS